MTKKKSSSKAKPKSNQLRSSNTEGIIRNLSGLVLNDELDPAEATKRTTLSSSVTTQLTKRRSKFLTIPSELITLILIQNQEEPSNRCCVGCSNAELEVQSIYTDYKAFSLVHSSLTELAQIQLFHRIVIPHAASQQRFLNTMEENPRLAELVEVYNKNLHIGSKSPRALSPAEKFLLNRFNSRAERVIQVSYVVRLDASARTDAFHLIPVLSSGRNPHVDPSQNFSYLRVIPFPLLSLFFVRSTNESVFSSVTST
jgi:hypothetical protein